LSILQANIYKTNERIEAVKAEYKLESDELNEWMRVQAEKEEDNLALSRYTKEDDSKEKELSLSIQKLITQVNKTKAALTTEVTETQVAQIELENTTEAFKRLHQERQDLIQQWETAVKTMKKRDNDINVAQANYRNQKQEIRQVHEKIKERQDIYQNQLNQNQDIEKNITLAERKVYKLREEETDAIQALHQYRDEVEVLKNTLNKSATDLVNKKSELNNLKVNLRDRQEKLERSKQQYAELKKRMISLEDDSVSLETRALQLEEMLESEKKKDKELDKQIKMLRDKRIMS
jgi:UDP-glucose:O-linked fucose beta-1,3-glucosyltransferase